MRLLLIHGRAQQGKSSAIIEQEWMAALRRGFAEIGVSEPPALRIDAPFYGDKLIELLAAFDLPQADQVATRGGAVDDGYADFLAEVAKQATDEDKVTDREIDRELAPTEPRGAENWPWVQAVIRIIDRRTPASPTSASGNCSATSMFTSTAGRCGARSTRSSPMN
jgi:hypothetical protein